MAQTCVNKDNTNKTTATKSNKSYFKSHSIPNVESGHYLIANVFKDPHNVDQFVEKLRAQGIDADYFENPKNGLNYVYLGDFENKKEALNAYRSKMDGKYQGDAWIMNVNGSHDKIGGLGNTLASNSNSKYGTSVLSKNVANTVLGHGKMNMAVKTASIDGLPSGFYIIASVFESSSNARYFVKELNARGLNASYFVNPNDGLRYVYLKKHETWGNALTSYYSKLNASYDDDMWIMRVKPNTTA